jgi:hypothetical protein
VGEDFGSTPDALFIEKEKIMIVCLHNGKLHKQVGVFHKKFIIEDSQGNSDIVDELNIVRKVGPEFYVELARLSDEGGKLCGFCGKENDFADDIGWFYLFSKGIPSCEKCYRSPVGDYHQKLFGVGDR